MHSEDTNSSNFLKRTLRKRFSYPIPDRYVPYNITPRLSSSDQQQLRQYAQKTDVVCEFFRVTKFGITLNALLFSLLSTEIIVSDQYWFHSVPHSQFERCFHSYCDIQKVDFFVHSQKRSIVFPTRKECLSKGWEQ